MNGAIRVIVCAVIFGLLASFAFRQSNTVAAQTSADEAANLSPQANNLFFNNFAPITINDNAPASLYPSSITVSGVNPAIVTKVQVALSGLTHTFPDDLDIILVAPNGQRTVLISDAGGDADVSNIFPAFSATAATELPDTPPPALATGLYRPANYALSDGNLTDTFPAPFPGPNTLTNAPSDLGDLNLTNPNGQWNLYIVDDAGGDFGNIAEGWQLILTVPTVFTVNSTADPGSGGCDAAECTLREAIAAAGSGDLINFASPLFDTPQIININGQLLIDKNLTIAGRAASFLTIRNVAAAGQNSRVIMINSGFTVELSGMTVTGGNTTGSGGGIANLGTLTLRFVHVTGNTARFFGGGIFNGDTSMLNIINSTVSNNTANDNGGGGGIENGGSGTLRVTNSTISGNRGTGSNSGGGIGAAFGGAGSAIITDSTITDNEASGTNSAGGVFSNSGTVTVRNSIIAANRNNAATPDVIGTFVSQGFNLIGNRGAVTNFTATGDQTGTGATPLNPLLAPLASSGGITTPTHSFASSSSPALDKGNAFGFSNAQNGGQRPLDLNEIPNAPGGDGADIGAFEAQTTTPLPAIFINDVSQNELSNPGTSSNFNFTVSLSAASGQPVTVRYQSADNTAVAASDYTPVGATTLTFAPGETSKHISIAVHGDTTVEPNETFFVNLSNPANGTIADDQGLGTILNDDAGPTPSPNPATLANISTRLRVETGDNALIAGIIITGPEPKRVMLRGIGPSLPFLDRLENPTLELRNASGTLLDSNDNWGESPNRQAIIDSTIAPGNDLESAIIATLPAEGASYTAILRGANNGTGIGVVEVYDLGLGANSKLANISTRGFVEVEDNVLIAGTIVVGSGSREVLIRAIGPSLPVPGAVEDPALELRDANGVALRINDDWRDGGQEAQIIATTIPPSHDLEAAIIFNLQGNGASYTAIVRGVGGSTGIAVVEVYALN